MTESRVGTAGRSLALALALMAACSSSNRDAGPAVGDFMQADPLATLEFADATLVDAIEIGGGRGGIGSRGTLEVERVWAVGSVSPDVMASAMRAVAEHDVYFSSLLCPGDYLLAGGVHRFGPYPGGVVVALRPDASSPDRALLTVTLRAAGTAKAGGFMPVAARQWRHNTSDRDGLGCPAELIEILESTLPNQPPNIVVPSTTTPDTRDLGG